MRTIKDIEAPATPVDIKAVEAVTPAPPQSALRMDLSDPRLLFNRELSWLAFNRRVLEHAQDPATPPLERLRFLTICSTNLDEFFEVRVAGLKEQVALGVTQASADGLSPVDALASISQEAHALVSEQYQTLNEEVLPALQHLGIHVLGAEDQSDSVQRWVRRYFLQQVLPVLTPVGLDPAHPFPRTLNKSLNFVVALEGRDAFGRSSRFAVVQAPRALPRVIEVPTRVSGASGRAFVLLSSVIGANVDELFPGMSAVGCYQFRVTRNSDLWVDEEEADDLLSALTVELPRRHYGSAVRVELSADCPDDMSSFLVKHFGLIEDDVYRVNGPVNLNRLAALYDLVERIELKYPPFRPKVPEVIAGEYNIFEVLRGRDVLLHHPYQSFATTVDFLEQAAADPDVLAIKITLYRTGTASSIVEALLKAARAEKEVTAVVELRARFDEEANIDLATRLQEAGANVVYGVVGYKTHAKMALVVRRRGERLERFAHLGTGNYHPKTARAYTDLGYLTASPDVCEDVHRVFQQLTGLGKVTKLKRLLQSPFTLNRTMIRMIDAEAKLARSGKQARIIVKLNSLSDPGVIEALYRASAAGVSIDLVVRGICCLRPGVPGVSENIRVRSVIGRFLEHSRAVYFHADGEEKVYCGSADWMERNLHRRVEVMFPVTDAEMKARVIAECFNAPLEDNVQVWELQPTGRYQRRPREADAAPLASQSRLLENLADFGKNLPAQPTPLVSKR